MICVPSQMKPYNTQRFVSNGIESVCTTLTLPTRSRSRSRSQSPNGSCMQVALVYRSPSASQELLITLLCRLLNYVSVSNIPCPILGDFNEDLMHQQNSRLLSLMSYYALHN